MDKRILICIVALQLASWSVFAIAKMHGNSSGSPIRFTITPYEIREGESIKYASQTTDAHSWFWDFGDDEFSRAENGEHTYINAGDYTIKLFANGSSDIKTLKVTAGVHEAPDASYISGPATVYAGSTATYVCPLPAGTCQWAVPADAANKAPMVGKSAIFTFRTPGTYDLVLTLHNPDKTIHQQITVLPAAEVPKAEAPKAEPKHAPKPHHAPGKRHKDPNDRLPWEDLK